MEIQEIIKPIGDACFIGLMIIGAVIEVWFVAVLGFIGFIFEGIAYNLESQGGNK